MMARALVALGGAGLTREERANSGLAPLERKTFTGSGPDWENAKADAGVPTDGLMLHWTREA